MRDQQEDDLVLLLLLVCEEKKYLSNGNLAEAGRAVDGRWCPAAEDAGEDGGLAVLELDGCSMTRCAMMGSVTPEMVTLPFCVETSIFILSETSRS